MTKVVDLRQLNIVAVTGGPNEGKTLSMAGEKFIKNAEESGGIPRTKAYNDGTGKWTIGWGCTEGVTQGMVITEQQAQEMFDREIAKHNAAAHRLIKRKVSQGLWDAIVSFFYNLGSGNCQRMLSAVNGGNEAQIRSVWMLYVHAYDEKLKKTVVWPGLVSRRTAELQHWAQMDHLDPEVPTGAGATQHSRLPAPIEPPKPGWVTTAAKSKSFWMQIQALGALVMAALTSVGHSVMEWAAALFGILPNVTQDVSDAVSSLEQMAGFLQLNTAKVILPLVIAAGTVALIRHLRDKRNAEVAI